MSTQENKLLVRRFFAAMEAYCQGDDDALDQCVSPHFTDHVLGTTGIKATIDPLRAIFADFRCTVDDLLAEEDRVVAFVVFEFTHAHEFMDVPPTGRRVHYANAVSLRISNGQIIERTWNIGNGLGVLRQLDTYPLHSTMSRHTA